MVYFFTICPYFYLFTFTYFFTLLFFNKLFFTILFFTILFFTILFFTILFFTILFLLYYFYYIIFTILFFSILYWVTWHESIPRRRSRRTKRCRESAPCAPAQEQLAALLVAHNRHRRWQSQGVMITAALLLCRIQNTSSK